MRYKIKFLYEHAKAFLHIKTCRTLFLVGFFFMFLCLSGLFGKTGQAVVYDDTNTGQNRIQSENDWRDSVYSIIGIEALKETIRYFQTCRGFQPNQNHNSPSQNNVKNCTSTPDYWGGELCLEPSTSHECEDARWILHSYFNIFRFFVSIIIVSLIIYSLAQIKKNKAKARKIFIWAIITTGILIFLVFVTDFVTMSVDKPVIYLYPETEQAVAIRLDYPGKLIASYPDYDNSIGGWKVTAFPDGTIINEADGNEYSYLFWESQPNKKIHYNLDTGFIVSGKDTKKFLQEILKQIGLTPKEYNEFIVYWYPRMQNNKYNLIHFAGKEYTSSAPLDISPTPDSVLRVFMVFKSLNKRIELPTQSIKPFERKGFTVVEWGGTELK